MAQQNHVLYRGRVRGDTEAKQGDVLEIRATREHSGCLVLAIRLATAPHCIGFFEDSDQAIEQAVSLAQDQRELIAMGKRQAVPA